jgi:hypothetical protein
MNAQMQRHMIIAVGLLGASALACNLLSLPAGSATNPAAAPNQPTGAVTLASSQTGGTATPTGVTAGQAGATAGPAAGSGLLAVSNSYRLQTAKGMLGFSLTAGAGKVWIGTGRGAIEEVDSQSGAFGQSILLTPGAANAKNFYPILKLAFDGQYVWALAEGGENHQYTPHLFAINTGSGAVAHQWDLASSEWTKGTNLIAGYRVVEFGISPGKVWMDHHIIDTQTFEAKFHGMIGDQIFAYNGQGWMWMTGSAAGGCDGLDFIEIDDPTQDHEQCHYPFLLHDAQKGDSNVGDESPLVLAGDRVWIAGSWAGTPPTYTLDAFSADMGQLMQETKPLVSVPLMDDPRKVKMLFADNFLWLLWTRGEKTGFLYQLDPQTGATINSLDVAVDQAPGEFLADIRPVDIATEGDNLWILMQWHLLRIKLP